MLSDTFRNPQRYLIEVGSILGRELKNGIKRNQVLVYYTKHIFQQQLVY